MPADRSRVRPRAICLRNSDRPPRRTFAQMLQDFVQAGDIGPNILGVLSGHTYYFLSDVRPRLLLPEKVTLDDILRLVMRGQPIAVAEEVLPTPDGAEASDGGEGGEGAAEDEEGGDEQEDDADDDADDADDDDDDADEDED